MELLTVLMIVLVCAALWSVMATLILRSAIALACTSAVLSIILFRLGAPLAAVFELSVAAGLISVIFISVISLMRRQNPAEMQARRQSRIRRFWPLPLMLIVAGIALAYLHPSISIPLPVLAGGETEVRLVMWNLRRLDIFGQVLILLAGVYGVLVLLMKGEGQ